YLNYYLGRHVGDEVLDISGTCPYYEKSGVSADYHWLTEPYDVSLPKAPVLATKSADGKHLYIVAAHGTADESLPCRVELKGFRAGSVEGMRLTQSGIDSPALVEKESDVIGPLPVTIGPDGETLEFECAARSVSFITVSAQ
ncbi:MAG: hypothetical protein MUQ26_02895, partial [Armatimonadetes bacterium]|nr:hypothetical protein [Armatimonadota bacterium]